MQPRTCLLSAFTLSSAMFFGVAAMAADLPKEGTDTFTNTWISTAPDPIKLGDRTLGTYELHGIHRNDNANAMMTNMGMRCLGMYEIAGSAPQQQHGACIWTDKDGDQIMVTFDGKTPTSGTETLVGGTGKFAGISGSVEWSSIEFPVKGDDKLVRGIVAEKVHWKLP